MKSCNRSQMTVGPGLTSGTLVLYLVRRRVLSGEALRSNSEQVSSQVQPGATARFFVFFSSLKKQNWEDRAPCLNNAPPERSRGHTSVSVAHSLLRAFTTHTGSHPIVSSDSNLLSLSISFRTRSPSKLRQRVKPH